MCRVADESMVLRLTASQGLFKHLSSILLPAAMDIDFFIRIRIVAASANTASLLHLQAKWGCGCYRQHFLLSLSPAAGTAA